METVMDHKSHIELLKDFLSTNFSIDPSTCTARRRNLSKKKLNKFLIYDDSDQELDSYEVKQYPEESKSILYNITSSKPKNTSNITIDLLKVKIST